MNEETIIKEAITKNAITNFITIAIVLVVLGLVIFYNFSKSIYKSADNELEAAYSQMIKLQEIEKSSGKDGNARRAEILKYLNQFVIKETSPRIIFLLRNADGTIISDVAQNEYMKERFKDIAFDPNNLDKIYNVTINGIYSYRAIIFKWDNNLYGQALINVDSEKAIIQGFKQNLVFAIAVAIFLILFASYFLSRETLKPIVASFKRQESFIQNASHELRTPLAIIQAKQESLLERPDTTILENAKDISITLKETTRLKKLIQELMDEARGVNKFQQKEATTFNLDDEIAEYESLYKDIAKKEDKKLVFNLMYKGRITANCDSIKELIIILLDNAFKYTNKGDTIELNTLKKDGKCLIEVIDTGIGISKEASKHIFERFYREEKSRQRDKGGMGLGLSIAYEIVKANKGTIKLDNQYVDGAKFVIKLPINKEAKNKNRN